MNEVSSEQFAAVCFIVLMQGYITKHPTYIMEKLSMLQAGDNAYSYLDRNNQMAVLAYLNEWRYGLPPMIEKYENELALT